ncbi:hypothetical protein PCASD_09247 [Puccinia coronata f. sp. avenae]|uniref:Uncharacterized protein n=1 Tax=Puccinia coronata f. sp. avenae TaxID=200324 RepID=A0A2N5TCJ2_9BASI|nr:hypothetical protein PCASD_09247 [Puccinia coronata f. sp. avenae]
MFRSPLLIICLLLCYQDSLVAHPLSLSKPLVIRGISNVNVDPHCNRLRKRTCARPSELEEACTTVAHEDVIEMIPPQEDETDVKPKPSSALKVPRKYRAATATVDVEINQTRRQRDFTGVTKKVSWDKNVNFEVRPPSNKMMEYQKKRKEFIDKREEERKKK